MPASASLLGEVREFLASLRRDWPEASVPPPPPRIPPVSPDVPIKTAVPGGDIALLFRSRAEHWAPLLGVSFGRVSVKDQRTLWGSCTREGHLNFSWRLALAPEAVLDYLIVHELAHRAQMNHSRRFWEIVERVCPAHRSHRRWLRKNAAVLHAARRYATLPSVIRPASR
ncbi:MAG: M48 family metallopeptidase [Elusimicrobia bacterium]|nr:M48 family metallopeptidase [Elusimicrobiota bacterium]